MENQNGYIAFYRGQKKEVYANTSYEAQCKAALEFKTKSHWNITVYLAEKNGETVVHSTSQI